MNFMKYVAGFSLFLLIGCGNPDPYFDKMKPLTNQQIADTQQFCYQHNLLIIVKRNSKGQTVFAQCFIP